MTAFSDRITAGSAEALLGPNPFVGFRARDIGREVVRVARLSASQPQLTARAIARFGREVRRILRDQDTARFLSEFLVQDSRHGGSP